jgi:hypothetical protein
VFLLKYQTLVGGTTYQDAAKAKWDGKIATYGSAAAYAEYIRDARAAQGYENGIIPWDIAGYVQAAQALHGVFPGDGYDAHADQMAQVVFQDVYNDNPGYFDLEDDKQNYWYNLGVTGVLDCFKIAEVHTGDVDDLVELLLESQFPFGGFGYYYQDLWDWQTTAYAVMSLARFDDTYRQEIGLALDLLAQTQDASGGFLYSDGSHYPEIAGEALSALTRGGASSSNVTMYAGDNAFLVVHNDESLWFEAKGSRNSADDDWALAGELCDGMQFSVNVPEYGTTWNSPWEAGSVHNFSDWEKYGLQLNFGPDVAGHEANVWRRPSADPDA